MRLVFFGSGNFAVSALEALFDAKHEISMVCTRPPLPAGRGRKFRDTAVAEWARAKGLEVRFPENPACAEFLRELRALAPDIGVLADYTRLLPPELLNLPAGGFLNIHPSLLPRWRGAAPVQRALLAGDCETGVCIMQMDEKLDRGPVLLMQREVIRLDDTGGSLTDRLAGIGGQLIVSALMRIDALKPLKLDMARSSYAKKIQKSESRIDWFKPAEQVDRQIRGLSPSPGAWSSLNGERLKFLESRCEEGDGKPGEILDSGFLVACGSGAVRPLCVQRAGKNPMDCELFLRGVDISRGMRVE